MTNRERILKLLNGEKPDQVPWFGDLDYWYSAQKLNNTLDEKYFGDGYFTLARDYGLGFYLQGHGPYSQRSENVSFSHEKDGHRTITRMITPKGELTQIQQFLPSSSSTGFVKHFVESAEDFEIFRYYIENLGYEPAYDEALRRQKIIGDNGILLCYTPRSPFMEMVTTYSGIENLVYMLLDDLEETEELLSLMETKFDIAAQITIDSPAECIMIPENLSSEVVGKQYYLKYLRGYEKKWIEEIGDKGKYSFIHMDGTLKGLLEEVADTGFHVLEALTPAPVGDMTMEEIAKALEGRDTIIWGGLPGVFFTPSVKDDEFDDFVKSLLKIMKSETRFVLGVADQVPPDGLMERVARVRELCDRYGSY